MSNKAKLVDLLQFTHSEESGFISGLNEDERSAMGASDHWSIKDEFAHIAAWKDIMYRRLLAVMEDGSPPLYDDLDEFNDELFQRYKDADWATVEHLREETYRQLVKGIEKISEEDLMDSESHEWLQGRSLWARSLHTGYYHPLGHLAMRYSARGDSAKGNQLMEDATRELIALEDSTTREGMHIYNLACYYALAGDQDNSIEKLEQAFSLNSDIIDWSKKDSDLESLWDDPRYLDLLGSAGE